MKLRPISMTDANFLHDISGTPEDSNFPTQEDWIISQLKKPNIQMFIANANGTDVAWLQIDHLGHEDELRWVVHPKHRNKGFGKQAARILLNNSRSPRVFATIAKDNSHSLRIAQHLGIEIRIK